MKAVYFVATTLVGVVMFWVGFQLRPVLAPWEQQEVAAVPGDESVEMQQTEQSVAELAAQGYLPLEELTVRIDDGDVQWFDGTVWHTVASMAELAKEDKFYEAQEGFREFEEQLKQQWDELRVEQESPEERGETLLVGQKETPKPVENPKPTKPAATAPAKETVSVTVAPSEGGGTPGGGDSGSSGDGTPGGDSGSSGGGTPGGDSGSSGGGTPGGDNGNSGGGTPGGDSGSSGGSTPGGDNGNSGGGTPGGDSGSGGDGTPGGGNTGDSGNTGGGDSGGDTGDGENMEWSDDYL